MMLRLRYTCPQYMYVPINKCLYLYSGRELLLRNACMLLNGQCENSRVETNLCFWKQVFCVQIRIQCCHFHFSQCIWRAVQHYSFATVYRQHRVMSNCARSINRMAYLQEAEIQGMWQQLLLVKPGACSARWFLWVYYDYMGRQLSSIATIFYQFVVRSSASCKRRAQM